MKRTIVSILAVFAFIAAQAATSFPQREYIWPKGKMPDIQGHQIAAMTDVSRAEGFKADKYRQPYIDWFEKPANPNGCCMILISGGSYQNCCDVDLIDKWHRELTALGFQCVNFVYRTPRPVGLPIYQSAWEDGQRAVRKVRSEAAKRGFDPEKIGTISMSAGSHLALLLGANSQTRAYKPVDALDSTACHINWAIVNAPAYVTTDGEAGTRAVWEGYGPEVKISPVFKFDEKTCPMCLHHGGRDPYTPYGSTLVYRELRKRNIPAELHLYPDKGHGAFGFERAVEFMRQMGIMGELEPQVKLLERFAEDIPGVKHEKMDIWKEGEMPCAQQQQCVPYIEWYIPEKLTTKSIQIIYSGGGYNKNNPEGFEVLPTRKFLNSKGMAVVVMKYRTPRSEGLQKHIAPWQDLQRAVKIVRSQAAARGLDPDKIGIMGGSAGGHLTMMGATSSTHQAYLPVDKKLDNLPCNVQWAIAIYPAYVLSDGFDSQNRLKGNDDTLTLAPELNFDRNTCPTLFLHGDSDKYSAMGSVRCWEKMQQIGVQSELHTLCKRGHCFHRESSPGTGSYSFMDRIWEFLESKDMLSPCDEAGQACEKDGQACAKDGPACEKDGLARDSQHFEKADDFGALDKQVQLYLQDVRDIGGTDELNSLMILKDGKLITEYYDSCYGPDFLNICWSASKTFTSTAVGFAVQDGLLSVDDKVIKYLDPASLPLVISDTLANLTVKQLLTMSSGLKIDPIGAMGSLKLTTPTKTTLEAGFKFYPGEKYAYNSHNTYLLSVIVSRLTGKSLHEYLQEKLFDKMGIHNYHWDVSSEGYDMGGWGLYITTESLAKMGQFYLQQGKWNGEQLLDPKWFEEAMKAQIYQSGEPVEGNDHQSGYGYQMWHGTHNSARFDGAHGQWVIICPDKNVVFVITQHTRNPYQLIKSVWTRFYDLL